MHDVTFGDGVESVEGWNFWEKLYFAFTVSECVMPLGNGDYTLLTAQLSSNVILRQTKYNGWW